MQWPAQALDRRQWEKWKRRGQVTLQRRIQPVENARPQIFNKQRRSHRLDGPATLGDASRLSLYDRPCSCHVASSSRRLHPSSPVRHDGQPDVAQYADEPPLCGECRGTRPRRRCHQQSRTSRALYIPTEVLAGRTHVPATPGGVS